MTHRLTHSHDASARLDATGTYRDGASWGAAAIAGERVEGGARPTMGRAIAFVGGRQNGRTDVSAGDGAGGDTR